MATVLCQKAFSIHVANPAPFDWSNLAWYFLSVTSGGPGSINLLASNPAAVPAVQNFFSGDVNVSGGFATQGLIIARASIPYNGPLMACAFNATSAIVTLPDAFGEGNWFLRVSGSHFPVINLGNVGGAAVYPFNVPSTGGNPETIFIEFEVNAISFGVPQEIGSVAGSFS